MATHPIRFGLQSGQQNVEWRALLELFQKADAWGYDSLWNFDHFYPIFSDPEGPCLEAWTTLAALGQATRRARLGHLVLGNTYRHPCITAKMAATLDHITGGRFTLGIGSAWFELEHQSFGVDFKTVRGRLQALDEACQIIRGMFTQPKTTVHGKHYRVTDAMCAPRPLQRPHPPIMIGGVGRKVLLKLVAKHADMWNAAEAPDTMRDLIGVLKSHGDAVGRDTDQIEKSVAIPLCYTADRARQEMVCAMMATMRQTTPDAARQMCMMGTKQQCLETVRRYVQAGVTQFILMVLAPYALDEIQAFAEEVIPAVR